ncbi:MAG: hypothetical protein GY830_09020 [Bacteroidetes bacterium]|nr:hypothetical protein [Bacteroidota bacterium]
MMSVNPKYITNNNGEKIGVILSMKDYNKMIDELEMHEDVKLYDKVKSKNESSIPLESYLKMRKKGIAT